MLQKTWLAMAMAAAFTLTGCGGGGGGGDNTDDGGNATPKKYYEVTAVDGYLHKAQVFLECPNATTAVVETNSSGKANIDVTDIASVSSCDVVVRVIAGTTIDTDVPGTPVAYAYTLRAPAALSTGGSGTIERRMLVTPFSSMVSAYVDDSGMSSTDSDDVAEGLAAVSASLGITVADLKKDHVAQGLEWQAVVASNLTQLFKPEFSNVAWTARDEAAKDVATKLKPVYDSNKGSGFDRTKLTVPVGSGLDVGVPVYTGGNTGGPECPVYQVVSNGVCVDKTCPTGSTLNRTTGACDVPPPTCTVLEQLVDGVCVDKTCPTGQQLNEQGECVTVTVTCEIYEVVSGGECVTKTCGTGKVLNMQTGICDTVIIPPTCEVYEQLVDGECVTKTCETGKVLNMQTGNCDTVVIPPTCTALENLVDGVCVPKTCPTGQQLNEQGECVTVTVTCEIYEVISGGVCVDKTCPTGTTLNKTTGVCDTDVVIPPVCTGEQELVNNVCVAKCATGEVRDNTGKCVVDSVECEIE